MRDASAVHCVPKRPTRGAHQPALATCSQHSKCPQRSQGARALERAAGGAAGGPGARAACVRGRAGGGRPRGRRRAALRGRAGQRAQAGDRAARARQGPGAAAAGAPSRASAACCTRREHPLTSWGRLPPVRATPRSTGRLFRAQACIPAASGAKRLCVPARRPSGPADAPARRRGRRRTARRPRRGTRRGAWAARCAARSSGCRRWRPRPRPRRRRRRRLPWTRCGSRARVLNRAWQRSRRGWTPRRRTRAREPSWARCARHSPRRRPRTPRSRAGWRPRSAACTGSGARSRAP